MSYRGVLRLAQERPYSSQNPNALVQTKTVDWIEVVKASYEEAKFNNGQSFAGAWVNDRVGWFPGLSLLAKYGILTKEGESVRGGRRAYWIMNDIEGTERALRELGRL